jgi:metal-sulfur cluster biosynthetic enzyme
VDRLGRMVSVEDVTEALRDVIDPELGLDFVELGLIYDVEVDGGSVNVTFTLTSPGCPIGPQVTEQIEEFVGELGGVEEVTSTMVFSPPWTPEKMSEDAKFALGF